MRDEKPILVLKPNLKSAMFGLIITAIIVIVFLSVFLIAGAMFASTLVIVLLFIVLILMPTLLPLLGSYLDYKRREYRFYDNKLEYFDGWWTINRHTVPYKKVTDITMHEGIVHRMMGTGNITLITAGSISGSATLAHVKNPEEVYEQLQKRILKV